MKYLLTLVLLAFSLNSYAEERATRLSVEQVLLPLNSACNSGHALYQPGILCLQDNLYVRGYRVEYEYQGQVRKALIEYYPEAKFRVTEDGKPIMKNHYAMPE